MKCMIDWLWGYCSFGYHLVPVGSLLGYCWFIHQGMVGWFIIYWLLLGHGWFLVFGLTSWPPRFQEVWLTLDYQRLGKKHADVWWCLVMVHDGLLVMVDDGWLSMLTIKSGVFDDVWWWLGITNGDCWWWLAFVCWIWIWKSLVTGLVVVHHQKSSTGNDTSKMINTRTDASWEFIWKKYPSKKIVHND